ncbi:MAG TPA: hypothetical protein VD908_06040 [Cytophagales bacterium]|nr:hypothetical protein [Cytophagales bacterium]
MEKQEKGKAENLFSEIGRKIDEILENTKENREELKKDVKEKLVEVKKAKERLETEFQDFTSNRDGKWTQVKLHLDKALEEVKRALDSISKKN